MKRQLLVCTLFLLSAAGLVACQTKKSDEKTEVKELAAAPARPDTIPPEHSALLGRIYAFYTDLYQPKDPQYRIKRLDLLWVRDVTTSYVDSLKLNLYLSGIETLKDNVSVRNQMIANVQKKANRFRSKGDLEKSRELENTIEGYRRRNEVQEAERKELEERVRIVRAREASARESLRRWKETRFYLEAVQNGFNRQDTAVLIFDDSLRIEDLRNEGPWEGGN